MRWICLLSVQVAFEGKGWMVLVIDNYDLAYFERKGCVQRDLDLNGVW